MKHILDAVLSEIKTAGYVPYSDSVVSDADLHYLDVLRDHYSNTAVEIDILASYGVKTLIEFGSYMGVGSLYARGVNIHATASDFYNLSENSFYVKWLKSNGVDYIFSDLNNIDIEKKFDSILLHETLEHLRVNPIRVLLAMKNILNDGGYISITVPNIYSVKNLRRMLILEHPYLNPEDLKSIGSVVETSGLHWIEFNKKLLFSCVSSAGFDIVHYNRSNLNYSENKLIYIVKGILSWIFPFVFDQHRLIVKLC